MYSSMAKYYDEIFPLLPAGIKFLTKEIVHAPPQTILEGCCGGPGAFPALPTDNQPSTRILDAGCATGKFSLALAEQGYLVDGIDYEEEMILRAREKSEDMNLTPLVHFQAADMGDIHALFKDDEFQTIICMGNTLPHITERKKRTGVLNQFHSHLSSDGVLILQMLNYDKILSDRPELLPVIETEHVVFTRSYTYSDEGSPLTFSTSIRTKETGEIYTGSTGIAPLTSDALTEELEYAGFSDIKLLGSYSGEEFDPYTSDVLLCTAHS